MSETAEISPRADLVLATNGQDHPRRWKEQAPEKRDGLHFLTFGHRNNKRPELTIRAFAIFLQRFPSTRIDLVVLGAVGIYRDELLALATELHIAERCRFPGFVSEGELHKLYYSASVVVMASTDEGFGLPIAEALYLGIPAVVTADSGMGEIFSGRVVVTDPSDEAIARGLAEALSQEQTSDSAKDFTWAASVRRVRSEIEARSTQSSK